MRGMSIAGRRGEILWKATLTGFGQQRTYDTWVVRFGLVVPWVLGDAVHVWDLPVTKVGGPCKAIRLRRDPDFKRRVILSNWIGLAAMLGGGGLLLAALALLAKLHFVAAAAAVVGLVVLAGLAVWLTRVPGDARNRAIRLLLGFHEWGSSDPATWARELVTTVVAPRMLGAHSFAALAERERAAGRWGEAMWAARLCAACEDQTKGQMLTDTILDDATVIERLQRVRRRPESRDQLFGASPGLRRWVTVDPRHYILAIN